MSIDYALLYFQSTVHKLTGSRPIQPYYASFFVSAGSVYRRCQLLYLAALCLLASFSGALAQSTGDSLLPGIGQYKVGFRHAITPDHSRAYRRLYDWDTLVTSRPMAISQWYPATKGLTKTPLQVKDYMRILKQEEEWEGLPDEKILSWFYADTQANRQRMHITTNAYWQAPPLKGKFPVVVYAPSYQASSIENFALCEYLASHGYVVLSSPSRGPDNRLLTGGTTRDVETQARDIQFLIGQAYSLPFADVGQLAVAGFSFGGMANVLAQMSDARIKALVCLDGSIRYQLDKLLAAAQADVAKVKVPFLYLAQKDIPLAVMQQDHIDPILNTRFAFFDSLRYSQAYFIKFHDLTHSYFSSLGVLFACRDPRQDKADEAILASYRWVNEYTLKFLNAYLKKDPSAKTFLHNVPAGNGIANQLLTIQRKAPLSPAFSFEQFHVAARGQGYLALTKLVSRLNEQHPQLTLEEGKLNNLGLQLLFRGQVEAGMQILVLATQLYPQSANAYDSLAEGYLVQGDEKRASAAFHQSLRLDPTNQNAIDQLKKLGTK